MTSEPRWRQGGWSPSPCLGMSLRTLLGSAPSGLQVSAELSVEGRASVQLEETQAFIVVNVQPPPVTVWTAAWLWPQGGAV